MPGAIISASRIESPRVHGPDRSKTNQKGMQMATAQERITVLPVDDHELARQGLRRMLELKATWWWWERPPTPKRHWSAWPP